MFRSNPNPIGAFTMVSAPLFFTGAFSSKTENKNKIEVLFKGFQSLEVTKKIFKKISDPYDLGSNV